MRVVTLATPATLAQARVTALSLRRHHPDWPAEIVLVGRERPGSERDPHPRRLDELLDVALEDLVGRHPEQQLLTLLLPRVLAHYLKEGEAPVLHLPASAWVLAPLEPLAGALERRDVLFARRAGASLPEDGLQPTEEQLLLAGRINEGLLGVGSGGGEFLSWWNGWLERSLGSADGRIPRGRPEDRSWLARVLELAPARFSAAVVDDPGCPLSFWNLHEHSLGTAPEGVSVDGRWPLRLLDLPGFHPSRPFRLNPLASRVRVSKSPALRGLCESYAAELVAAGWSDDARQALLGRTLPNGLVYDEAIHELNLIAETLGEQFGDPFAERGADALTEWLEGPAPEGGAHGINRYLFYRVTLERPDVLHAYPDLDGPDGVRYVEWCRAFGRDEMGIPERFLPTPSRGEASSTPSRAEGAADDAAASSAPAGSPQAVDDRGSAIPAVRVTGFLTHSLGLGAAARGYAQALVAAGVPTSTTSVPLHHMSLPAGLADAYGRHGFEDHTLDERPSYEIVAVNPDELPGLVERLGSEYFHGPRIGVWGWETDVIPSRWKAAFDLVDEVWVYSHFMAEHLGGAAPMPVFALPPPVQAPAETVEPLRLGVPAEAFMFLFVFDYLSTIQRKNPMGLIEAFKRAFAPAEGPHLLIKTINAPLRPLAEEEVLWAADGRPDVHVVDRSLSGAERDGLMAACDCYVSLHRSEGFGLTLAEAMAIGKPVIATRFSGNMDFMDEENSYLVDHELVRVGPECEIYPAEGRWAEPSIEQAAALLREVASQPEDASQRGERARERIREQLSPEACGQRMRRRLEELSQTAGSLARPAWAVTRL